MKSRTTISYVILKYDQKTDRIFTKTANNDRDIYQMPRFDYEPDEEYSISDMKEFLENQLLNFNTFVDDDHIFIPSVNVTTDNDTKIYNYLAIVFESDKNVFSSMNYESWHGIQYNKMKQIWHLPWESGLTDPIDFDLRDVSTLDYIANPNLKDDRINFCNAMRFVSEQTKIFPILGLLSGSQFTLGQLMHYHDVLGIEGAVMSDDAAFETRYANSVKAVADNKVATFYRIKSEFLQK